ncbi:MAG: glycosyltransferase [Nanoarchaeota archaeon]
MKKKENPLLLLNKKSTVFIKTYTFESGLWYLAKSLGDYLISNGFKVIYIPKSKYIKDGVLFKRNYLKPKNPEDFEREIILNFTEQKTIEDSILPWIVKYNPEYLISFETLMEKSQWIPKLKNKTGIKIIDIPMIEWVSESFLKNKSYRIFDQVWNLTDVCSDHFKYYDNSHRVSWNFVDNRIFFNKEKSDLGTVKYYHAATLNPEHDSKNTNLIISAFDKFSKTADAKLIVSGILSKKNLEIVENNSKIYHVGEGIDRSKIAEIYQESDCVIAPSTREGLGLSLYEAKACGCKLITSDYPPMNEHNDSYLCQVSEVKKSRELIPFCNIQEQEVLNKILLSYEDIQNERKNKSRGSL